MRSSRRAFDETKALDAAVQVFWKHGYQNSSLDALCGAMGIGRQSLYAWLGDKKQLFLACLRRFEETETPELIWAMLQDGAEGRKSVIEMMRMLAKRAQTPGCNGCLLTSSLAEFAHGDAETRAVVEAQLGLFTQAMEKALHKAKRSGDLVSDLDVESTAKLLLHLRNGLMLSGRAGAADSSVESVIDLVEEYLLKHNSISG